MKNDICEEPILIETPTGKPHVSTIAIVSVTYNRCEPLISLLSRLKKLNYPQNLYDIYLVDNASSDETVSRVTKEFPEVKMTCCQKNLGTSAGFNIGIKNTLDNKKSYDYIWLLDSDAEVESNTLIPLIELMQTNRTIGIIGSTVYDPDERDRVVATGLFIDWNKGTVSLVKPDKEINEGYNEVDLIAACSLMIRTKVCKKIGLWDERFWVYWGDTDWCQRVLHSGWKVCGHFKSRVWHRDWANTQRTFNAPTVLYDDLRGGLLFNIRHHPNKSLAGAQQLILKSFLKGGLEFLTMRSYFVTAYFMAVKDFMRGDFQKRGWHDSTSKPDIKSANKVCEQLESILPENPKVMINLTQKDSIQKILSNYLTNPKIQSIQPVKLKQRKDFNTDINYFKKELWQLFLSLFKKRYDVMFTEVGKPHLYTLTSARYTVLIDNSGNGFVQKNKIISGLFSMLLTFFKGIKVAFIELPESCRNNADLQAALSDPSTSESTLTQGKDYSK